MTEKEKGFNFRWGVPWLDDKGYIEIPGFIKRNYAKLGIKPTEMMMIGHLASYKYDTPKGKARPSLKTIAKEMGYAKDTQVRKMVGRLEEEKLLQVERIRGKPSIYVFAKLANECMKLELESTPIEEYPPNGGDSTPQMEGTVPPKRGDEDSSHSEQMEKDSAATANATADGEPPAEEQAEAKPEPKEKPEKPAKPDYWGDFVVEVRDAFNEPMGIAVKIAEQLLGIAPNGDRADHNVEVPAQLGQVKQFIEWYNTECPGCSLRKAEAVASWWHKFVSKDSGSDELQPFVVNGKKHMMTKQQINELMGEGAS